MRPLYLNLLFICSLFIVSCEPAQEEPDAKVEGDFNFFITGINKSLTYTFSPATNREASTVPNDVRQLVIYIVNAQGELVYEQYYYNHYDYMYYEDSIADMLDYGMVDYYFYENSIPDTLFIPKLEAGEYSIMASTSGWIEYYYDYAPNGSINSGNNFQIGSSMVSESPVYVGQHSFVLGEDEQEVNMSMKNISARITVSRLHNNADDGWVEIHFGTKNNHYYSFSEDAILDNEYDYDERLYLWMDWQPEKHFYVLPKTLTDVYLSFYDYRTNGTYYQDVDINPNIALQVGDAISFSINEESMREGSGKGSFSWEDITWNDLGEINIP